MHVQALESRTFMSANLHTVSVPLRDSASGNLPGNQLEGTGSHLGRFTGAFNEQGVLVFTAANGDELWIETLSLGPTPDPGVWHVESQIIGGTGRFTGATGAGSHDLFVDDRVNFAFSAETTITLQRPWNNA
jgi:hypothetical protein